MTRKQDPFKSITGAYVVSQTSTEQNALLARFSVAIYLIAFLCIVGPPLELVLSMPMIDVENVRWRFGAVGLLIGAIILPLLGLVIALVTSLTCRHLMLTRILIVFGVVATISMVLTLGLFVLDSVQVRGEVAAQELRRFDITVIKQVLLQIVQIVTLFMLLRAGVKGIRMQRVSQADSAAGLILGRSAPGGPQTSLVSL